MAKKRPTELSQAQGARKLHDEGAHRMGGFKLPKSVLSQLPELERQAAEMSLWHKSNGQCSLCGEPLNPEHPNTIVVDHQVPAAHGGTTILSNLYLAHRTCNASRQDLPLELARPLIKLRKLSEERSITFDEVLDRFVQGDRRLLVDLELREGKGGLDQATIHFGQQQATVAVYRDPATKVRFFFTEVPVPYLHNDTDIQPRSIMHAHVRRLAIDFRERPVHEPSNCRLDTKSRKLLQFDGQHKSTAQILIGRRAVPVKVYIDPDVPMIQELVIKIQQDIKKQPLTRSETLSKISDVLRPFVEQYAEPPGKPRTEQGLIDSQPKSDRKKVKKLYCEDLLGLALRDEENKLTTAVLHQDKQRARVTTDKVLINRVIEPLMSMALLASDMDNKTDRDTERRNIVFILNLIAEAMLPNDWHLDEIRTRRATNFFYQGAIGWWMGDILIPTIRYLLMRMKGPLLQHQLSQNDKDMLATAVKTICGWEIWSTSSEDKLRAFRSNTVENVKLAFPGFTCGEVINAVQQE